jgi:hypothetical protein
MSVWSGWKKEQDAHYPFQVDIVGEISGSLLSEMVRFCEPHEQWSTAVMRPDGQEVLRVGFVKEQAARDFCRRFNGEAVPRKTQTQVGT